MTAINESWSYRGTSLQGTNWNIRMLSPNEQAPGRRGDNIVVPNRDGRIYRSKAVEQRMVSLAMFAKGTGGTALATDLNTLKALFGLPGEGTLARRMAGQTADWTIAAEVAAVVDMQPLSHQAYAFVVEFLCADPYWQGESYSVTETDIASSPATFAVSNNGTAINERATITVAGVITNPKIQVGDVWVQYTGTVASGKTLVIDCENFTATYDGSDGTANITHGGAVAWLRLLPGSNTVTVTGSSLTTPDVTVAFRELWL